MSGIDDGIFESSNVGRWCKLLGKLAISMSGCCDPACQYRDPFTCGGITVKDLRAAHPTKYAWTV